MNNIIILKLCRQYILVLCYMTSIYTVTEALFNKNKNVIIYDFSFSFVFSIKYLTLSNPPPHTTASHLNIIVYKSEILLFNQSNSSSDFRL